MFPTHRHPQRLARTALLGLLGSWSRAFSAAVPEPPVDRISPPFPLIRQTYRQVGGGSGRSLGGGANRLSDAPEAEARCIQDVKRLTRLSAGNDGLSTRPAGRFGLNDILYMMTH
jgi:hypothetical protein